MLRIIIITLVCFCLTSSQKIEEEKNITVSMQLEGCDGNLNVFSFDGIAFNKVMSAEQGTNGIQKIRVPRSQPKFFYLGLSSNKVSPILLGSEENLKIRGQCNNLRRIQFQNSPLNKGYLSLKNQITHFNKRTQKNAAIFQKVANNPVERSEALKEMDKLDQEKLQWMDSVKSKNDFLGKIAALNVYLSFPNNGSGYKDEVEYFVKTYFQFVDWQDPVYNDIVYVFEAFRQFSNVLTSIGLSAEQHRSYLDEELLSIPQESQANRFALGGVLSVLRQKNHPNYIYFATRHLKYFDDGSKGIQILKRRMITARTFVVGGQAPDFTMNTPESSDLSLSQLRGKVVLIDFWASWCGPCRRENPKVVGLYERYKDRGFEVLGVSLDKRKARWEQAIEIDGLKWPHVSDLKGWKSKAAQLYGVNSIPHTILIDREGRILARGLRGESLERKLQQVFRDL